MASMTAFAGEKIVSDELTWRLKLKVFEAVTHLPVG